MRYLAFVAPHDGPGMIGAPTTLRSRWAAHQSRHQIEWLPWLRVFRVTYEPDNAPRVVTHIFEHRIKFFELME